MGRCIVLKSVNIFATKLIYTYMHIYNCTFMLYINLTSLRGVQFQRFFFSNFTFVNIIFRKLYTAYIADLPKENGPTQNMI